MVLGINIFHILLEILNKIINVTINWFVVMHIPAEDISKKQII